MSGNSNVTTLPTSTRGKELMIFGLGPLAQFAVDLAPNTETKVIEDNFTWPDGAWGMTLEIDATEAADAYAGAAGLHIANGLRPLTIQRGPQNREQMLVTEKAVRAMRMIATAGVRVRVGLWG